MCDPRWVYGLPIALDSLIKYAKDKAPECFYEGHRSHTSILVIEKFERHFGQIINTDMAIDIFDPEFDPKLVLILHEEHPHLTKLTLEDEDYLRNELNIKEKGKWYRYVGSFFLEHLEEYKKTIPGPIPSRARPADVGSTGCSGDVIRLSDSVAAVSISA